MKSAENYLDYVFQHDPALQWDVDEDELVVLHVRRRGLSHFIARKFFDRPGFSHIHLEPLGSFIWKQIDGRRNVYEIGQLLHETFGEEAEPLYERLSVYMKQLENNRLIRKQPKNVP